MKNLLRLIYHKIKHPKARIAFSSMVSKNTVLGNYTNVLAQSKLGSCKIGDYTYIGTSCTFERTKVGKFTSVGPQVMCGMGTHPLNFVSTYPGFYSNSASGAIFMGTNHNVNEFEPVTIGSDVWIGARAIIVGGVNIGHGAVIAAGTVVTKDIPPYAIAGGVPAKIIRYRFDQHVIKLLLESKWWDYSVEELQKAAPFIKEPNRFLKNLTKNN